MIETSLGTGQTHESPGRRPTRLALPALALAALIGIGGLAPGAAPRLAIAQSEPAIIATYTLPDTPLAQWQNEALPEYPIADDRGMLLGGIGSDLWQGPGDADDEFWMVTDRGPNGQIEVEGANRRTFPVPDFTPVILCARAAGERIEIVEAFPLVGQSGAPVTGLSNIDGHDEKPWDYSASVELEYNPNGLDTEGLVRLSDGTFWLADEYGPSLIHVDAGGTVVARYVPEGLALTGTDYPVNAVLPAIYDARRGNRGFEGLAVSPDETTLYATLQSPLRNPDADTGDASLNTRILAFDIASGAPVAEYVYQFEPIANFDPQPDLDQAEMKLSGIVALDADTLIVLERTDWVAKLYTVELAAATNILGSAWNDPATAPSLEGTADLMAAGVTALPKTLLVDLQALEGMPGKIEGVAVVDESTIAVINDNDFDIGDFDANGRHIPSGKTSQLLLVSVALPLGDEAPMVGSPEATPAMAAASGTTVEIVKFKYEPRRVEIAAGETVTWINRDQSAHTATQTTGARAFDSGRLNENGDFSFTFAETGVYDYECAYHKDMVGLVIVR